ncbi:DddA-like double-stranded DNA deaminase toxin [Alloactinosynnema sp. L-07]|uniref:DddA-like double-stranded DNA deaminase toxin n=1 Tax=Alloactinosynnema sp. L-07 TaxID=1653480 RepID=UPI0009ED60AB|nr:DddA-like double-stranded DNA deaminase toxin [Alloactinosynnema sp. L-07]
MTLARHLLEEAHLYLTQLAATSTHAEMHQAAAGLLDAVTGLAEVEAALSSTRSVMQLFVATLIGDGSKSASLLSRRPRATGESSKPIADVPAASESDKRAAKLLERLPVRGPKERKTSGYWVDDDGAEHGPLVSGHQDGYQEAVELLRALSIAPARGELWAAAHVEVKLAARLRSMTAKNVTLAINNQPCDTGPWSCDQLLPQVLRPGQRVTIYWPSGKQTYRGREA